MCWSAQNACQILYQRLEPIRQKYPDGSWESWVRMSGSGSAACSVRRPLFFCVLRSLKLTWRRSVCQLRGSSGRTDHRLLPPDVGAGGDAEGVCPQGSGPLRGLGEDGGPTLRLLHLRSLLLRGGAGLPLRGLQGQSNLTGSTWDWFYWLSPPSLCVSDPEDRHRDGHREKRESLLGHRPGVPSRQEMNKNRFSGGSTADFSAVSARVTDRRRVHAGFGSLHSGGAQVLPLRSALHAGAVSV